MKYGILIILCSGGFLWAQNDSMMIRIAEIEVDTMYIRSYHEILRKEAEASVRLEPGVVCIYPMYQSENPSKVQILEVYASRQAYELHLTTPHFLEYKTSTTKMVKSLKLLDMNALDRETMSKIFLKWNFKP